MKTIKFNIKEKMKALDFITGKSNKQTEDQTHNDIRNFIKELKGNNKK